MDVDVLSHGGSPGALRSPRVTGAARAPLPQTPELRPQALGNSTTQGAFDEAMYRYAISMPAQDDPHVEQVGARRGGGCVPGTCGGCVPGTSMADAGLEPCKPGLCAEAARSGDTQTSPQ